MPSPFHIDPDFVREVEQDLLRGNDRVGREVNGVFVPAGSSAVPSRAHLTLLLEAAFWGSLTSEEGRYARFGLAYAAPTSEPGSFVFEEPRLLDALTIAKAASALEETGQMFGVWPDGGALKVWGFSPKLGGSLTQVRAVDPGLVVVQSWVYNIAVLSGIQSTLVDPTLVEEAATVWAAGYRARQSTHTVSDFWIDMVREIARMMRSHRRGGALLLVPHDDAWKGSLEALTYRAHTGYVAAKGALAAMIEQYEKARALGQIPRDHSQRTEDIQDEVDAAVERERRYLATDPVRQLRRELLKGLGRVARLTSVDGAVVANYDLEVIGFGAKIKRREEREQPFEVAVQNLSLTPDRQAVPTTVPLAKLGGMRHTSAARFVAEQRKALAIVASQDGRVTVMYWVDEGPKVMALQQVELALV